MRFTFKKLVNPSVLVLLSLTLVSCLKDPGNPSLTLSSDRVAVGEEVEFKLEGAENYSCILWTFIEATDFTIISGGERNDKMMICSFTAPGTYDIRVSVKNCKSGCTGTCRDEYAEAIITVN